MKPTPEPFGARRARQIWEQRREQNAVDHAMTPAERAYVGLRWRQLPASACWMDAFFEILQGPEDASPQHDEVRNHRIERVPRTSEFDVQGRGALSVTTHDVMTVEERYCAHCRTWVECQGVTGALKFMAFHEAGDCPQTAPNREQKPPDPGLT